MRYLFLFLLMLLIVSCSGWKTRVSCQVNNKVETLEQIGQKCWQQPEFGIKKDF